MPVCCLIKVRIVDGELLDGTIYTTPSDVQERKFLYTFVDSLGFQTFCICHLARRKAVSQNFNVILSEAEYHFIFIRVVHVFCPFLFSRHSLFC